jgi:tetratricopeptide (TPR) repeat protein
MCVSRAVFIVEELTAIMDPDEAQILLMENLALMGTALREMGRYRDAEGPLRRGVEVARKHGDRPMLLAIGCNNLGVLYKCTGRFEDAERLYREAQRLIEDTAGQESPDAATLYHNIGRLEHARGRFDQGLEPARKACQIRKNLLGADHPATRRDSCVLAGILEGLGRYTESLPIYATLSNVISGCMGPNITRSPSRLALPSWSMRRTAWPLPSVCTAELWT